MALAPLAGCVGGPAKAPVKPRPSVDTSADAARPARLPLDRVLGHVALPAGVLSNNGAGLVSNNGAGLIGNNSAGLIGNNSAGVVGTGGAAFRGPGFRLAQAVASPDPDEVMRVPDVEIKLRPLAGGEAVLPAVRSDARGEFAFATLPPPGLYEVAATVAGAREALPLSNVVLVGAQGARADLTFASLLVVLAFQRHFKIPITEANYPSLVRSIRSAERAFASGLKQPQWVYLRAADQAVAMVQLKRMPRSVADLTAAIGQIGTASPTDVPHRIRGVVLDTLGAPVVGATVTAVAAELDVAFEQQTTTDASGAYGFARVPDEATIWVQAAKPGYRPRARSLYVYERFWSKLQAAMAALAAGDLTGGFAPSESANTFILNFGKGPEGAKFEADDTAAGAQFALPAE